jgi:thiol:disulfide interchange protein
MPLKLHTCLQTLAVIAVLGLASPGHLSGQAGLFKPNPNLYSETASASTDISVAIARARRENKRILLDFGGNWCGDCQVLDLYYHQSPNAELLAKYYILVHVNIGHMDQNVGIAKRYNVPITKGVPALAVLDSHGRLLYSEHEKEFEHTSLSAVTAFLNRWKA